MSESTDLKALFADYASGSISTEQLHEMEAALRNSSDLRREFVEYMNIDSALGDLAALSEAEATAIDHESTTLASRDSESIFGAFVRHFHAYRTISIVGTLAASLFVAVMWLANLSDDKDAPVAMLVTDVDALLMWEGKPWNDNELLTGKYRLDKGLLHLKFDGDVMVYVEAPARFDAVSGSRLVLHSGRLSANVPPQGVGFTVDTPEAEVTDFGTEFSIDVDAGASEVHVFDGLVRVQPRSRNDGQAIDAVDLRTSQAVKIQGIEQKPVEIKLATDRFIRNFDEPKHRYPRAVKKLSPVAFYRMAIRDKGLAADPPQYSGVVLTGEGRRPPHARGVSNGGSLRVLADSTGRGGRVDSPPPLRKGQFTLAVFVYLESRAANGTVATNIQGKEGNFALSLNESGSIQATVRNTDGDLQSVSSDVEFPLQKWCHLVLTADGEQLQIYENGQLVVSSALSLIADNKSNSLWFGTDADGVQLWDGRVDELALFDKALSKQDVQDLFRAALDELANTL